MKITPDEWAALKRLVLHSKPYDNVYPNEANRDAAIIADFVRRFLRDESTVVSDGDGEASK